MWGGPLRAPLIGLGALGALLALIIVGVFVYRENGASGVLANQTGSGPGGETTEVFTADGAWDLHWSYDCSSSLGSQYRKLDQCDFMVAVKQMSDCGVSLENQGIVRHGGPDHGVVHNHVGGTFYFVVDSYGSWRVSVTGSGQGSGRGPWPHCSEG